MTVIPEHPVVITPGYLSILEHDLPVYISIAGEKLAEAEEVRSRDDPGKGRLPPEVAQPHGLKVASWSRYCTVQYCTVQYCTVVAQPHWLKVASWSRWPGGHGHEHGGRQEYILMTDPPCANYTHHYTNPPIYNPLLYMLFTFELIIL